MFGFCISPFSTNEESTFCLYKESLYLIVKLYEYVQKCVYGTNNQSSELFQLLSTFLSVQNPTFYTLKSCSLPAKLLSFHFPLPLGFLSASSSRRNSRETRTQMKGKGIVFQLSLLQSALSFNVTLHLGQQLIPVSS